MGPAGSAIWHSMLDAAEKILCEEGYGALTSRRIAEHTGVKQRLVYYYFHTMDDLIVETFRRGIARESERMAKAMESEHPLREIWDAHVFTPDARLIPEFMALANHVEPLRAEVKSHIEKTRQLLVSALIDATAGKKDGGLPPIALAIFATGAALLLDREAAIGVRTGHAEVRAIIDKFLADAEGNKQPARKVKPTAPARPRPKKVAARR